MIYLDHNAATPLLPQVREAMEPYLAQFWGNPSSLHGLGRKARSGIEQARSLVAAATGADQSEVVFTSGATESNNTAILSAVAAKRPGYVLTTGVEHSSILAVAESLRARGVTIRKAPVDRNGELNLDALAVLLPEALLVSTSWANNETGVIFPVARLSALCAEHGVLLHIDAAQAFGKMPLELSALDFAYLSLSAHKIGGPKGVGALVVRPDAPFSPSALGGDQEAARRAGTENVAGIVGFGAAAVVAAERASKFGPTVAPLRDDFEAALLAFAPGAVVNGAGAPRLANTTNIALPIEDAAEFVIQMDRQAICVSAGSACHAGSPEPSHVLTAMGVSRELARRSVRFSLGYETTRQEISLAAEACRAVLAGNGLPARAG